MLVMKAQSTPNEETSFGQDIHTFFNHKSSSQTSDSLTQRHQRECNENVILNLLSPRDPGTGALPQHLAGNSV